MTENEPRTDDEPSREDDTASEPTEDSAATDVTPEKEQTPDDETEGRDPAEELPDERDPAEELPDEPGHGPLVSMRSDPEAEMAAPAAVHRHIGEVGVRLNEAHAHLSTLRTATEADSAGATEVRRAEAQALVEILEEARTRLDAALDDARTAARDAGVDVESDDDDERDSSRVGEPSDVLWNTTELYRPQVADDPE